jgi:hypothetical protein
MLEKVTALAQGKSIPTKSPAKAAPQPVAGTPARPAPVAPTPAAPTPVAARPPVQAPSTPPVAAPKPAAAPTPAAAARPAATPASGGNKQFPAAFASGEDMASKIPIATPIPFAPADAPTAGMLKRLQAAGGAGAGLDPKTVQALLSLSRDVIEQVVWEVVPDMAEQILARGQQARH